MPRKLKPTIKCPVCEKGIYLHHKYKYHVSFKCNNKKCNHTINQLRPGAIADSLSEQLIGKNTFWGHRFSVNTIITAINLYYALNSTTREISTYLSNYMNIKVSHYADETVVKVNTQKYYLWICINSESKLITSWNLSSSRCSDATFSLFKQSKKFGSSNVIVTNRWASYIEAIKTTFYDTKHIRVESFHDNISNNLIESFNKTFKSWYKKIKGFKSFESANSLISNLFFITILSSLIHL